MFVNKLTLQDPRTKIKKNLTHPGPLPNSIQLPLARDNYYPNFCINHLLFFIVFNVSISSHSTPIQTSCHFPNILLFTQITPIQCDMRLCKSTNTRSENHWGPF